MPRNAGRSKIFPYIETLNHNSAFIQANIAISQQQVLLRRNL